MVVSIVDSIISLIYICISYDTKDTNRQTDRGQAKKQKARYVLSRYAKSQQNQILYVALYASAQIK